MFSVKMLGNQNWPLVTILSGQQCDYKLLCFLRSAEGDECFLNERNLKEIKMALNQFLLFHIIFFTETFLRNTTQDNKSKAYRSFPGTASIQALMAFKIVSSATGYFMCSCRTSLNF